ncbi:MAG: glycosyltransferase [Candidatus Eremiobacteraeota bacterium]|nr:glycosyltransferase [Candidatus Eremiobacteraeota bacterium]
MNPEADGHMSGAKRATIVVTPREQFSKARRSLESILAHTDPSVPLVYVDGNSPPALARYLQQQAARHGFTLLRTEHYLAANEARNLALPRTQTKYVVFVDNDVSVSAGWFEKLIACAEETGAWAVGPLYLIDDPAKQLIHTVGADLKIIEEDGVRRLHERHLFSHQPVSKVKDQLVRRPIDLVEFHCMLVRRDALDRLGPLDEGLISFFDHIDFCLQVAQAGGTIFSEPTAVVTHLAPPPFSWSDLPCFFLRWSDAWMKPSITRFAQKHRLDLDDEDFRGHRRYRDGHRLRLLGRARGMLRRIAGQRGSAMTERLFSDVLFGRLVERTIVNKLERQRASANSRPARA